MFMEHKSSDEIFKFNFHSSEGWYSKLLFESSFHIKVVGMAFDDFFREPVIWKVGNLARCPVTQTLTECIGNVKSTVGNNTGIRNVPPPQVKSFVEGMISFRNC